MWMPCHRRTAFASSNTSTGNRCTWFPRGGVKSSSTIGSGFAGPIGEPNDQSVKGMSSYLPNDDDIMRFVEHGYVLVRGLLNHEEATLLERIARKDRDVESAATTRSDARGGQTVLAVRDSLGDDIYSAISRSNRVVRSMEQLLGDEVYHYHHKLMLKEPYVGGAWEWHQDYGYWYNYGCLYPSMASCYIAIDPANQANGCLQVIPGSQHLGRLDHGKVGGQTGCDPARVAAVLERLPLEYVEMEPGDGLFFHGLLLHRSDQNTSPNPRWAIIHCYNTKSNSPYERTRHNAYAPIDVLPNQAVMEWGQRHWRRLVE
jgi:ectoine hydroxylase-related dioxygenase (phytanoyl-CoA dioxygenase family)